MSTRTNIVLDDKLVKSAMKATGAKTKREVVDTALRRLVHARPQKNMLDLVGQDLIDPGYDVRIARGERARGSH